MSLIRILVLSKLLWIIPSIIFMDHIKISIDNGFVMLFGQKWTKIEDSLINMPILKDLSKEKLWENHNF